MRSKRNQAIYDVAGRISEHEEARTILEKAEEFLQLVGGLVRDGDAV